MSYINLLRRLMTLMRTKEWWDKIQIVFAAALILLIFTPQPMDFLGSLVVLGLYMSFLGSYGYVINSYADRRQDMKAGKHPEVSHFSNRQLLLILCFLALGALGIPLYYNDIKIKILGAITFFLATFYSVRPIRFKERGILGIIIPTLPQRPLPFLFFVFLISSYSILTWFLLGWLTLIGLVVMFAHQLLDFENDKKAQVDTWAQGFGFSKTRKFTIFIFGLTWIYMCIPPFLFGLPGGLAISLIIFISSKDPIFYILKGIKATK